jgi:hypothetical protein
MKPQSFCNANKCMLLFTIMLIFLTGCRKDINDEATLQNSTSGDVSMASQSANDQRGSVAIGWHKLQLQMILSNPLAGPDATRLFSYTGITLYEAVQNGIPGALSLHERLYQMPSMPAPENNKYYHWTSVANAALADITRNLYPNLTTTNEGSIDSLEKAYNDKFSDLPPGVAARSQIFGKAIAAAIFNWSKSDNYDHVNDPYTPPVFPGAWVPTPPIFLPAAVPYFGNCRTFLKEHNTGTTPAQPIAYSEDPSSDFYKMEKAVYHISKSETNEQKTIALFWNDVNPGYTPPGHEISILDQVLEKEQASLSLAAQAYAKASIAQWDATIVCFRSKYKYNLLRPVTYIQKFIDTSWMPLLFTPPFPEYPAAHAYITSATMEALTSIFGKNYAFTDHTYDFLGYSPRSYSSLEAAAIECGKSRFYGGIHYLPTINVSHQLGLAIGNDAANVQLIK